MAKILFPLVISALNFGEVARGRALWSRTALYLVAMAAACLDTWREGTRILPTRHVHFLAVTPAVILEGVTKGKAE